jgi:hypothetical protein
VTGAAQGLSLALPQTPLEIAVSSSATATLVFDPTDSSASAAGIQVSIQNGTAPYVLNVTGEGNYAPLVEVIVSVTDAIPTPINGEYELQGGLSPDGYRVYSLPATDYRIFGQDDEGIGWYFDTDFDTSSVAYLFRFYDSSVKGEAAGSLSSGDWGLGTGVDTAPNTVGEFDLPSRYLWESTPISAHFRWADAEGDGEGTTLYQWYISDTTSQYGTYSAIDEETGASFTPGVGDVDYYLKVVVTPTATDGTSPGQPVELGPVGPVLLD